MSTTVESLQAGRFEARAQSRLPLAEFRITGVLTAAQDVQEIAVSVLVTPTDSSSPSAQFAKVNFDGPEAVTVVTADDGRMQVHTDSIPAGVVPYMQHHPVFLTLLAQRALLAGADSGEVPVFWLFTDRPVEVVRFDRTQGALQLSFLQSTARVEIDTEGWPARATIQGRTGEAPRVTYVRRSCQPITL